MNEQLRRRLKAQYRNVDDHKLKALEELLGDEALEQLIRYKDTPSAELRRVETALKAAKLNPDAAAHVLKTWEAHGEQAAMGLLALYNAPGGLLAQMFQGKYGTPRELTPR